MTEVDNQDAAGADVCKIVGLAFRCERKAADRIPQRPEAASWRGRDLRVLGLEHEILIELFESEGDANPFVIRT